ECCWRTERTHPFLRWRRPWGCTIKPFSAVLSGRSLMVQLRRSTPARQGAHDHGRGQGLGCEPRLPQGQGTRVSTRSVDNATPRPPCARAGPSRGAQLPCQTGSGHVVQHTQWAGDKAAQSALLPRTTRTAVQKEDGGGSVRLPPSKAY